MCFYIEEKNSKVKIANKDIVCYKIVDKLSKLYVNSRYTDYKYKLDELNKEINLVIIDEFKVNNVIVNESKISSGYHSYISKERAIRFLKNIKAYDEEVIVKCIIPRNSYYYINKRHKEYVSSNIIINKIM